MSQRTREPEVPPAPLPARARARQGTVTLLSFGFKYGPPPANHCFDVSFLRNPAREARFGLWSERSDEMRAWVLEQPEARAFLDAVVPLVELLSRVDDDARVALGCSGGRHRSAILAEVLAERLAGAGVDVRVVHREGAPS